MQSWFFGRVLRYYRMHVDIAYLRDCLRLGLGLSSRVRVSVMVMVGVEF